jgi:hypothetical protein
LLSTGLVSLSIPGCHRTLQGWSRWSP